MFRTRIGSGELPVMRRNVVVVMALAMVVVAGIASGSGDGAGGGAATRKIVMRGDDRISPSALTMSRDDVLEFENHSGQFIKLIFVEPADQASRIRCYPLDPTIVRPDPLPWMLFDWGAGRRLTATIPPGKFASACSLVPGQYAFVAMRVNRDPRGTDDSLGTKGTITVQ